jgi:hypothetical protein
MHGMQEVFVLRRSGMLLELDGVQTAKGKWSTRGQVRADECVHVVKL